MRKFLLVLIFFQFFIVSLVNSQSKITEDNSTKIFIKSVENRIDSKIIAVASYGLTLEDNQTVSYKVISKIVTDNENILDTILTYVSNVEKIENGDDFILEMGNARYEKPQLRKNKVLQDVVCMLNIMSNRAENIEVLFNFSPKILKEIYFQMSYSNGRYVDDNSYSLSAISAGIGGKYKIDTGELLLGIHYGGKASVVSQKKLFSSALYSTKVEYVGYLELLYRGQLINNNILYSVGSKYYFSNISVQDVNTKFNISLGIGIKFNVI
ncbi:MAG: hypothetical protein PVH88_12970 [Ignavibacteria bacterium]|jgi:hypothetical protein